MLTIESFKALVAANNGFEVALGFRNDVDHFIGGTGGKYWYFVQKGSNEDFYVCDDAAGTETHFTRKKKILSASPAPAGKTEELILAELAAGQAEIESSGRKPAKVDYGGHPCSHYSFAFGERAYKIADEYGVTVEYSNLNDEAAGFRLRSIKTGKDVKAPKET